MRSANIKCQCKNRLLSSSAALLNPLNGSFLIRHPIFYLIALLTGCNKENTLGSPHDLNSLVITGLPRVKVNIIVKIFDGDVIVD